MKQSKGLGKQEKDVLSGINHGNIISKSFTDKEKTLLLCTNCKKVFPNQVLQDAIQQVKELERKERKFDGDLWKEGIAQGRRQLAQEVIEHINQRYNYWINKRKDAKGNKNTNKRAMQRYMSELIKVKQKLQKEIK